MMMALSSRSIAFLVALFFTETTQSWSFDHHKANSRRDWIQAVAQTTTAAATATAGTAVSTLTFSPTPVAAQPPPIQTTTVVNFGASWSAVDGLNTNDGHFVAFDANAYNAMKDDPTRTPFFRQAISERLGDRPEDCVVVDVGTGPFALFAILAAQLGAGKVYAIEANPEAAASARRYVQKAGFDQSSNNNNNQVVEVVQGFSTDVTLPIKADFVVAEIVGSIASEEGAYATILDAQRFLKEPQDPRNWIPCRIQTYAAPASYGLHNLFGPPEFDWTRLKDPVRFSCRDQGLQLLSDPQLVEDIRFDKLLQTRGSSGMSATPQKLQFTVDAARIPGNRQALLDEFLRNKRSSKDFAANLATQSATSFSGVALWPRVHVSPTVVVDSRQYPTGNHQRSHWQTVLPIMAARPIANLKSGEIIDVTCQCNLPSNVQQSPSYDLKGTLSYNV